MNKGLIYALLLTASTSPTCAFAQDDKNALADLESLGDIVTSVSKKPEDSFRSPAAVYVLTNEDIKLSGATHIAEALRLVPGLDVARMDSSNWAISSRGFNEGFANKLLVLVDGRTIYTPLFSGVYWDIQNLVLEDIDRIEVIRGPGAALWGANAVNGIINIITKEASTTQGLYASTLAGNEDRSITDLRYGGAAGKDFYYRAYAKYENRDGSETTTGLDGNNNWDNAKGGFRADWNVSDARKLTLQGDLYDAGINLDLFTPSLINPPADFLHDKIRSRGMNVLGKWQEQHNPDLQSNFQAYFDYQSPDYSSLRQDIYTFDFDYQTAWRANNRNEVMWGAGVRYIHDNLKGTPTITVSRENFNQAIYSAFLQDQYALIPKDLYLTIGSKFEHNEYTGFEIQPSARLAWYPDNKQTVWAAISRAVRTPSRAERDITYNYLEDSSVILAPRGNPDLDSEEVIAYEIGYRIKPMQTVSIDTTAFFNDYDQLRTYEPGALEPITGGFLLPYVYQNLGEGHSYGFEASTSWDVTSRWNLLANYSYINLVLDTKPGSADPTFDAQEDQSPHHQLSLRSQLFLPYDAQLINTLYYVDDLKSQGIDDYWRFDTQVIWKPTPAIELALVGQNLLDSAHPEYGAPLHGQANEIERAVYGRVTFRY